MNFALLRSAVDDFNEAFADRMEFNAVKYSPRLLYGMMERARAEGRADIADAIIAACEQDDPTPAHRLYHQPAGRNPAPNPVCGAQTEARGGACAPQCTYLVRPDGGAQVECGAPATHRNGQIFYCRAHADQVSGKFNLVNLATGKLEPKVKRHILI